MLGGTGAIGFFLESYSMSLFAVNGCPASVMDPGVRGWVGVLGAGVGGSAGSPFDLRERLPLAFFGLSLEFCQGKRGNLKISTVEQRHSFTVTI